MNIFVCWSVCARVCVCERGVSVCDYCCCPLPCVCEMSFNSEPAGECVYARFISNAINVVDFSWFMPDISVLDLLEEPF